MIKFVDLRHLNLEVRFAFFDTIDCEFITDENGDQAWKYWWDFKKAYDLTDENVDLFLSACPEWVHWVDDQTVKQWQAEAWTQILDEVEKFELSDEDLDYVLRNSGFIVIDDPVQETIPEQKEKMKEFVDQILTNRPDIVTANISIPMTKSLEDVVMQLPEDRQQKINERIDEYKKLSQSALDEYLIANGEDSGWNTLLTPDQINVGTNVIRTHEDWVKLFKTTPELGVSHLFVDEDGYDCETNLYQQLHWNLIDSINKGQVKVTVKQIDDPKGWVAECDLFQHLSGFDENYEGFAWDNLLDSMIQDFIELNKKDESELADETREILLKYRAIFFPPQDENSQASQQ